jgi:GTPase SAR1 family protein
MSGPAAHLLADLVDALADREEFRGIPVLADIAVQCREPLRVAITGDVSSGKSTLVNALLGQPLAAVQRAETTSAVTWYRDPRFGVPPRLGRGQEFVSVAYPLSQRVVLADTPGSNTVSGAQRLTDDMMRGAADAAGMASVMLFLVRDGVFSDLALTRVREFTSLVTGDLGEAGGIVLVAGKADMIDEKPTETEERLRTEVPGLALRTVALSQHLAAVARCGLVDDEVAHILGTLAADPDLRVLAQLGWDALERRWVRDGLTVAALDRLADAAGSLQWIVPALPELAGLTTAADLAPALQRLSRITELERLLDQMADDADVYTVNAATRRLRTLGAGLGGTRARQIEDLLGEVRREPAMIRLHRTVEALRLESTLFDRTRLAYHEMAIAVLRGVTIPPGPDLAEAVLAWRRQAAQGDTAAVRGAAAAAVSAASRISPH